MMTNEGEKSPIKKGKWENEVFTRPGQAPTAGFSPEEGCFSMVAGAVIVVLALVFWGIYYWYNEPEFHPERQRTPVTRPVDKTRPAEFPKINP